MIEIFEKQIVVQAGDIDVQDHVGNERYVVWMSQLASGHSDALGWTHQRYTEAGVAWFVREHKVRYHKPAVEGDVILGRTWVATIERMTSTRQYEFLNRDSGDLLVRAETQWAFFDITRQRPCRILPEVASVFTIPQE